MQRVWQWREVHSVHTQWRGGAKRGERGVFSLHVIAQSWISRLGKRSYYIFLLQCTFDSWLLDLCSHVNITSRTGHKKPLIWLWCAYVSWSFFTHFWVCPVQVFALLKFVAESLKSSWTLMSQLNSDLAPLQCCRGSVYQWSSWVRETTA